MRHANCAACLLHELAHRSGHTALLLGGTISKAAQLAQLESAIQSGRGAFVEPTFTLLIIRPDGHVGLRADDDHLNAFAAYQTLLASGHV